MPRHIIIKVLKFKEKERILKSARRVCVCWGGGWQIIVYVQVNKTVSWFFQQQLHKPEGIDTIYSKRWKEREKKKECIYNQNTLCGKVIIQNLSRDKAFPRVFPGGTAVKHLPSNVGNTVLIPDLGRSHIQCSSWTCVPWLLSPCSGAWKPWPLNPHATVTEANMPQSPRSAARESTVMRSPCTVTSVAPTHRS